MLFKSISYKNYRCFLNGKIEFNADEKRNMSILIAPNGGGKTETLFSFWWVLYDFDFKKLRNKENTPYAINSALYRELEKSETDDIKNCSVTLEFEEDGIGYSVKKICEYRKIGKKIKTETFREFNYINKQGETSLLERDQKEIEKKLNRIIPKMILNGIIFDGERMQKLSSTEESSIEAIKGIINDISNVELLEICKTYFEDLRTKYNKDLRHVQRQKGNMPLDKIILNIDRLRNEREQLKKVLEESEEELEKIERLLEDISDRLVKNAEVKRYENERIGYRALLDDKNKQLDSLYKSFSDLLNNGYLFACTSLFDDVRALVDSNNIPQGLNVAAVKSILSSDSHKCICGRELDEKAIQTLDQLIGLLPPDNINSTLQEMMRSMEDKVIPDQKKMLNEIYDNIHEAEKIAKKYKEEMARLSAMMLAIDENGELAKEAITLEHQNNKAHQRKGELQKIIGDAKEHINEISIELTKLTSQRDAITSSQVNSEKINNKISFIEKSLKALEMIKEINKETALLDVNEKISKAYPLLSEDYDRGRNIKIIQYNNKRKYQMAVYMKTDVEDLLSFWKSNGEYRKKLDLGLTKEEIEEEAIIKCIDSNSTGQSKINTFAFVKAILDYSNNPKSVSGIEIKKEYPLLIDAPFGDIASDNLRKSSQELHNFSHQVILMIDEDKYESLRKMFDPYMCDKYIFKKVDGKNYSEIERM